MALNIIGQVPAFSVTTTTIQKVFIDEAGPVVLPESTVLHLTEQTYHAVLVVALRNAALSYSPEPSPALTYTPGRARLLMPLMIASRTLKAHYFQGVAI
ncbi:hypothetical protein J6590_097937, partial [Homalodisca vitripennis]